MSGKKSDKKKPVKKKASARGLGRGLSALMADVSVPAEPAIETKSAPAPTTSEAANSSLESNLSSAAPVAETPASDPALAAKQIQFISISRLDRNPDQPRKRFNEKDLEELTTSIAQKGVLQPILVRPIPPSQRSKSENAKADFQIVAGERRWQASLKAGLDAMPVLIRDLSDQEVLEIGVVEKCAARRSQPNGGGEGVSRAHDGFWPHATRCVRSHWKIAQPYRQSLAHARFAFANSALVGARQTLTRSR